MKKTLSILGSTGSIGRQTLKVAEACGHEVAALTVNRSVELAEAQARKFRPKLVAAVDENAAADLCVRLADTNIKVLSGQAGVLEAASPWLLLTAASVSPWPTRRPWCVLGNW